MEPSFAQILGKPTCESSPEEEAAQNNDRNGFQAPTSPSDAAARNAENKGHREAHGMTPQASTSNEQLSLLPEIRLRFDRVSRHRGRSSESHLLHLTGFLLGVETGQWRSCTCRSRTGPNTQACFGSRRTPKSQRTVMQSVGLFRPESVLLARATSHAPASLVELAFADCPR